MVLNNKIYDHIKSGNFDQDQGEIREKSGNFISHSEWEPCIYILFMGDFGIDFTM